VRAIGVEPVSGDLRDASSLAAALAAAQPDAIVHLAAETAVQRREELVWETNFVGTESLYRAARELPGLSRFVFASTVVVGDARGALLTEETPLPVETAYGRAKQACEKLLLDGARDHGFPAIVVRPSHVYGPGGWFLDALRDMRKGLFRIPGDGTNLWDVVHADDVARAFALVLKAGPAGEIYHVVDDTPVTMGEFFDAAARHLGKRRLGHAPLWLARLLRGRGPIAAAVRSARSSNQKIRQLGWTPRFPEYRSGLEQVFAELGPDLAAAPA
jgi:nucleoside-diphosphate-sugar epimerase